MEKVAELTGMEVGQLSRYALIGGIVLCMFGIADSYITCVLGVAYPVFMTFLALESKGTDDDKQWLTYWVVFGLFNIIDQFAGFVLHWIPFYYFLKLCFLVYLFHPSTKGATTVYNFWVLPYLSEYNKTLDDAQKKLSGLIGGDKTE